MTSSEEILAVAEPWSGPSKSSNEANGSNSVDLTALSEVSKMTTRQGIHNNVARDCLMDLPGIGIA
jgi:hypothetical protein